MESTSISLLERLRQPDPGRAWERFVELYTPLLLNWARRHGLQHQDAADLVQEVFVVLVQKLPEFTYDRDKSFRNWLRTVLVNKWRDRCRRQALPTTAGEEILAGVPDPDDPDASWEVEHRRQLLRRTLELMRPQFTSTTWKACWEFAAEGRPAAAVAAELGISENAVYIAKSRVLRRLRQELEGLLD
jgi:RNA polymerase sigma-70 factor (ECF subfamily)